MSAFKQWGGMPTIWTHPSGIGGVTVTDYFDAAFALPKGALIDTYKHHQADPDAPISIPVRDKVLVPAVLDKNGKVVTPAVIEVNAKGEPVKEIVSYTEYTALVEAEAAKPKPVDDVVVVPK